MVNPSSTRKTTLLMALALSVSAILAAATITQTASAINDKFTTDCSGPGESSRDGPCPGGSRDSGPHDETTSNPAGNVPPGQQEEERDD